MSFDVGAIQRQVDAGATELEELGEQLEAAIYAFGEAEHAYQLAYEKDLIRQRIEAKESGERLPAEDVRQAIAHQHVSVDVRTTYEVRKAMVDGIRARARATENAISARQSLLRTLTGAGG